MKQNYPKGRNGGRRKSSSDFEDRPMVERNNGRFRRSNAEMVADFWPLAHIPALLVTYGLWHFLVMQNALPWRVAVLAGIATAFALNSLLTIWFYKTDKRQAEQQLRRIPEFSLHFWELFCGWPGALYAQRKYHHKWKKTSYMIIFWSLVILNILLLLCLFFPGTAKTTVLELIRLLRGALSGKA